MIHHTTYLMPHLLFRYPRFVLSALGLFSASPIPLSSSTLSHQHLPTTHFLLFCYPRFVLSALGLFSASPGSADLVLGSPLFRHVRVWRGVCEGSGSEGGNGSGGETSQQGNGGGVGGGSGSSGGTSKGGDVKPHCDYSLPSSSTTTTTTTAAANPSVDPHATHPYPATTGGSADIHHPFLFPPTSSYLDIVALGTSPIVSKVVGVTFNGIPVSSDR